ncbi:hypothetical protein ACXN5S_00780 [Pseudoroseicyclus sp. H15]
MKRIRKFTVAAATFGAALGIGFLMQNQDAVADQSDGQAPPIEETRAAAPIVVASMAPAAEAPLLRPAAPAATLPQPAPDLAAPLLYTASAAAPDLPVIPTVAQAPAHSQPGLLRSQADGPLLLAALGNVISDAAPSPLALPACDTTLTASAVPGALVALTLMAPCDPATAVTFHHRGMMFSALTDEAGGLTVTVPALAEQAGFIAELAGGQSVTASAEVPDIGAYDRAVLQWEGTTGLELHALEYGAGYDDAGHVWWGAPSALDAALKGRGGYMTELGTETPEHAYFAEIYTFPTADAAPGQVHLSVEAIITPDNCERDISAQSLQLRPGGAPAAVDLTLTVPGCDSLGEYLVLSNMLEDLTLAAQ